MSVYREGVHRADDRLLQQKTVEGIGSQKLAHKIFHGRNFDRNHFCLIDFIFYLVSSLSYSYPYSIVQIDFCVHNVFLYREQLLC